MYYSIYDKDTWSYLHTGRNSKTKRECIIDYIFYRQMDLWEYRTIMWLAEDLTDQHIVDEKMLLSFFARGISEERVNDDMIMANFEIHKHKEKLEEDSF